MRTLSRHHSVVPTRQLLVTLAKLGHLAKVELLVSPTVKLLFSPL